MRALQGGLALAGLVRPGVRAVEHDVEHWLAALAFDHLLPPGALGRVRGVLEGVVQEGGRGLVHAAAVLEHEPLHLAQMGDVGDLAALALLLAVPVEGELVGLGKAALVFGIEGHRSQYHRAREQRPWRRKPSTAMAIAFRKPGLRAPDVPGRRRIRECRSKPHC